MKNLVGVNTCVSLMFLFYFKKYSRITSPFSWKLCVENEIVITFAIEHEINKFNAKVTKHYRYIGLYSKDVSHDIAIINKYVDSFWNVFNTKAIKLGHTFTIGIQSYPVNSLSSSRYTT